MDKTRVLITGTSSYGVGEGVLKIAATSRFRDQIRIIAASNSRLCAFQHLADRFVVLPSARDPEYQTALEELLEEESVTILIPGSEAEMEFLAGRELKNKDVKVWVNQKSLIDQFNSKLNAEAFFLENRIPTPVSYSSPWKDVEFPLLIKPEFGKSSEGIKKIVERRELEKTIEASEGTGQSYIVQKMIQNAEEYTVSVIRTDGSSECLVMKRYLLKGATQYAVAEKNQQIEDLCLKISERAENHLIINIQLMKNKDGIFVIEVNPRFSGSAPMRALLGYNEFDILFSKQVLKQDLNYEVNYQTEVIRGYIEYLLPSII